MIGLSGARRNTHEDHCRLGARALRDRVPGGIGRSPDPGGCAGDPTSAKGDQYGWAVDYETAGAARQRALSEWGPRCSVVLTFERCAAYAADQEASSSECGSRGGSGCTVRVWGCNGPVVEEGLGVYRAARREVQEGLRAAGFDPGGADGMFGPRTRVGDPEAADVPGCSGDGVSGRRVCGVGGGSADVPPAGAGGCRGDVGITCGCATGGLRNAAAASAVGHGGGTGESVLAVDRGQHEPGGGSVGGAASVDSTGAGEPLEVRRRG